MRILLVINGTDFGGTEVSLVQIAAALARRGHAVHALSMKPIGPIGERIREAGVPVSTLGMNESVGVLDLLRASRAVARLIDDRGFDVVHSFLPRANIVSRLALRMTRQVLPHVANEESTDYRRARGVRLLNRLTARWSARILAVSAEVRDALVAHDGLPPERFEVLPKGVDLAAIDAVPAADLRAALGLSPAATLLCSVGRLIPDKGHAYLLRALARLPDAVRDVHLVLVGGGPEDKRLRAAAAAAGLGGRVHLLGVRADPIALMKAADVFVLPSLEEGLPVVLLEAMSCALPIVAADVGSVKSLIRPGETGMLVPPAERWANGVAAGADERTQEAGVAALADALAALLADRGGARALGAAARTFIERFRTVESSIARLEQLYAECLAGAAPVPVAAGARAG